LLPTDLKLLAMPSATVSQPAAIQIELGANFVSLEPLKSIWLEASLSPDSYKKFRHTVSGGYIPSLLARLEALRDKAQTRVGERYPVIII